MDKYQLYTNKVVHYEIFKKICKLIQNKQHESKEGILQIINLAYNMNKDGKRRKLTKEEYINKYINNKLIPQ
jgi:hypothetical protein